MRCTSIIRTNGGKKVLKEKQEFHFGDFGSPLSKSPGKSKGPNVDTILVAGDVKKPIKYKKIWTDQQDRQERHKSRNAKDFARHKGVVFKPICSNANTLFN